MRRAAMRRRGDVTSITLSSAIPTRAVGLRRLDEAARDWRRCAGYDEGDTARRSARQPGGIIFVDIHMPHRAESVEYASCSQVLLSFSPWASQHRAVACDQAAGIDGLRRGMRARAQAMEAAMPPVAQRPDRPSRSHREAPYDMAKHHIQGLPPGAATDGIVTIGRDMAVPGLRSRIALVLIMR